MVNRRRLDEPFDVGSQVANRAPEPDIPWPSSAEAPRAKRGHRQAEAARNFVLGHGWVLLLIHTIVLARLVLVLVASRRHDDTVVAAALPAGQVRKHDQIAWPSRMS